MLNAGSKPPVVPPSAHQLAVVALITIRPPYMTTMRSARITVESECDHERYARHQVETLLDERFGLHVEVRLDSSGQDRRRLSRRRDPSPNAGRRRAQPRLADHRVEREEAP